MEAYKKECMVTVVSSQPIEIQLNASWEYYIGWDHHIFFRAGKTYQNHDICVIQYPTRAVHTVHPLKSVVPQINDVEM